MMNEAMLMQQIHYEISSQKTVRSWVDKSGKLQLETSIRASFLQTTLNASGGHFQLAFILMNVKSLVRIQTAQERDIVDVIWFPTGGGKTEAYLGLSAFSMFLRRLRNRGSRGNQRPYALYA